MKRLAIIAAALFATIVTAHADTVAQRPAKAHGHPQRAVVHRAAPRPAKTGYDQNHGAYDPWYWDWSYGP